MINYYSNSSEGTFEVDSLSSEPVYIFGESTSPWTPSSSVDGSGTIVLNDIEATVPYKIRLLVYYYNNGELWQGDPIFWMSPGTLNNAWWGGLSSEFSVTEGANNDIDITLDYYNSGYIMTNEME